MEQVNGSKRVTAIVSVTRDGKRLYKPAFVMKLKDGRYLVDDSLKQSMALKLGYNADYVQMRVQEISVEDYQEEIACVSKAA